MKTVNHVLSLNHGNHPDFKQIEAENGIIKIEQIREMQEEISQKPIVSERKVYIINDSDYMTAEARKLFVKNIRRAP